MKKQERFRKVIHYIDGRGKIRQGIFSTNEKGEQNFNSEVVDLRPKKRKKEGN